MGTNRFIFHIGFDEALRTPGDLEVRLPGSSCLDTGLKWVWLIVGVAWDYPSSGPSRVDALEDEQAFAWVCTGAALFMHPAQLRYSLTCVRTKKS